MVNEFREWMAAMGFNGKQVTKAGELIGMGASTAQFCYRGERRVTKTERLAMAAVTSDLPLWSVSCHNHFRMISGIKAAIELAGHANQG